MDPIADMLNRLMNGQAALKQTVDLSYSLSRVSVLDILKESGFIKDFKSKREGRLKTLTVILSQKKPIGGFKKVSRPGKRIFRKSKELKRIKSGHGLSIVSTSKGVLTEKSARQQKVGGELWLEVW